MHKKIYEKIKHFIKENYKEIIFLIIFTTICFIKFPYIIETPGGTVNLNERITVENAYDTEGEFGMAYVTVLEGRLPLMLLSFILPNWDLIHQDDILLDNETLEDMYKRDKLLMDEAISNAKIAAFNEANIELTVDKMHVNIAYIYDYSKTELKIGDEIISIDNTPITNLDELKTIITSKEVGTILDIEIKRNDEVLNIKSEVYESEGNKIIGVLLINTYEFISDIDVTVSQEASESGPSGGLMTALSIYNYLTEEDITKGRIIIGTGTIDNEGNIGEIGGVKYKLLGAEKDDADIFLCPEENYEEALEVKEENNMDIEIISVKSLNDAINKLLEE